jgi:hypothetical protein
MDYDVIEEVGEPFGTPETGSRLLPSEKGY